MAMSPEETVRTYLMSFGKSIEEDHRIYRKFLHKDVKYFSGTTMVVGSEATVAFSTKGQDALGLAMWRVTLLNLAVNGDRVFVERIDHQLDKQGKEVQRTPIMGIFKVKDGQIVEWRDYWDVREMIEYGTEYRKQNGMPPLPWGSPLGAAEKAAMEAYNAAAKAA